jgi:hypothetical protein
LALLAVAAFSAIATLACATASEIDAGARAALANWSLPVPGADALVVCHGYGCLYRTPITLTAADHARLAQILAPGRVNAESERRALAQAEAWYEKRVAPEAGTAHAKARAGGRFGVGGDPSQFDCIDTTANTTMFLIALDRLGLLRHHRVIAPTSRIFAGGPHFTALIEENRTGRKWTVDPWPHDNGQLPDVWPVERWYAGQ